MSFLEKDSCLLPLDLFNLAFNILLRQIVSFFALSFNSLFDVNFFFLENFDTIFVKTSTLAEEFSKIVSTELNKIYNPLVSLNADFLELISSSRVLFDDIFLKKNDYQKFDFLTVFFLRKLFKKFYKIFLNFKFSEDFLIKEYNSIL